MQLIYIVPNLITIARAVSVPFVITFILDGEFGAAFWLFVAAGASDGVDGFIAKRFNAATRVGAYLDPIADKALLVGVFVTLGLQGVIPNWLFILVISRDIAIIGAIMISQMLGYDLEIAPHFTSKINTLAQILLAAYLLFSLGFEVPDGDIARIGTYIVGGTTAISWLVYLASWIRSIYGWQTEGETDQ